eukprot:CAMPEP_0119341828 /NCGR_PEP_ID=MMETSP1333-20130426/103381_1 /TAXON_ID=418940 /ORGANISM="Scyphosphaera apsteinii, Strain RCC1455" /LENGTH=79 /DNA_ID=CAMNT_0007353909 /DNA_START=1 /DNA_END=240 /DNA_ORIENTATION=+
MVVKVAEASTLSSAWGPAIPPVPKRLTIPFRVLHLSPTYRLVPPPGIGYPLTFLSTPALAVPRTDLENKITEAQPGDGI